MFYFNMNSRERPGLVCINRKARRGNDCINTTGRQTSLTTNVDFHTNTTVHTVQTLRTVHINVSPVWFSFPNPEEDNLNNIRAILRQSFIHSALISTSVPVGCPRLPHPLSRFLSPSSCPDSTFVHTISACYINIHQTFAYKINFLNLNIPSTTQ